LIFAGREELFEFEDAPFEPELARLEFPELEVLPEGEKFTPPPGEPTEGTRCPRKIRLAKTPATPGLRTPLSTPQAPLTNTRKHRARRKPPTITPLLFLIAIPP
jgi:hypothetical protein